MSYIEKRRLRGELTVSLSTGQNSSSSAVSGSPTSAPSSASTTGSRTVITLPSYTPQASGAAFSNETARTLAARLPGYTYNLTEEVCSFPDLSAVHSLISGLPRSLSSSRAPVSLDSNCHLQPDDSILRVFSMHLVDRKRDQQFVSRLD